MIDIVKDIGQTVDLETNDMTSVHVSIHEDNARELIG